MFGSRLPILLLFLFAGHSAFGARGGSDHEISAFYTSFAPNVGGLPEVGARYRGGYFEGTVMFLNNIPAVEAGLLLSFEVSHFFHPHMTLGGAYALGTFAAVTGAGVTFRLFKLGPGYVSLGWDNYIYVFPSNSKAITVPIIPLSLTYAF